MKRIVVVGASITCENEEQAVRAVEALSRVAVGLALEGQSMNVNAIPLDEEDES